jgi:hypothetical protein
VSASTVWRYFVAAIATAAGALIYNKLRNGLAALKQKDS